MGTRSLTHVMGRDDVTLVTMYRQMDGYPNGHGAELLDRFGDTVLVNGIGAGDTNIANGMDCLAAQVVAHFKEGPGRFYLMEPGTEGHGEEFIYTLREVADSDAASPYTPGTIYLTVRSGYGSEFTTIYYGPLSGFNPQKAEVAAYG